MKSKTSKQAFWLRNLLLLPMLAFLIYSFSEKKSLSLNLLPFKVITDKGASEAMMEEYREFIKDWKTTNRIIYPKLQRAIAIYDIMSPSQITTVKMYPKIFSPSSLSKVKPKTPSAAEYNSWKNKKEFAIWIDGKVVDNYELNNYSTSDFKYYTSSFVYNNARSEKFPQPFQNNLFTKIGFEETYLKSGVKNYNHLKSIKDNSHNNDELRILEKHVDKAYRVLTKEQIEKYDVEKLTSSKITDNNKVIVTRDQVIEYNKLWNLTPQESKPKQSTTKNKNVTPESYYAGTRFISYKKGIQYKDTLIGEGIIIDKFHEDLTGKEKKTFPFALIILKPKRKKSPTQEEIEEFKIPKKYAIWIDHESVPNSALENYKLDEIAYFSGRMTITKTGRTEKYPQPFWCMFYTHKYFDDNKMGEQKTKYGAKLVSQFQSIEKINKNFH